MFVLLTGPTVPPERKVLFIRNFGNGHLVREDKLSHEEVKAIFKNMWSPTGGLMGQGGAGGAGAPAPPERAKTLGRKVKKALGMGKKLQQKQGQLIYKGMPG